MVAIPHIKTDKRNHANVLSFLAQLTTTAEYENLQARAQLAGRIVEAFNQMAKDAAIKSNAFILMDRGLSLQGDRNISLLEEIESMICVHKIKI